MPIKKTGGVTLIEMLLVISILGILVTIMLNVFSNPQSSARNSRRKSDLKAIAEALESAKTDSASSYTYPKCNTLSKEDTTTTPDGSFPNDDIYNTYYYCPIDDTSTTPSLTPSTGTVYIKDVPRDPKDNTNYYYIPQPNCTPTVPGPNNCGNSNAVCNNTTISCTGFWLLACLEDDFDPQVVNNPEGFAPDPVGKETQSACGDARSENKNDRAGYIISNK